jgi:hypothetical protein
MDQSAERNHKRLTGLLRQHKSEMSLGSKAAISRSLAGLLFKTVTMTCSVKHRLIHGEQNMDLASLKTWFTVDLGF